MTKTKYNFKNKLVLVTAGSKGIGKAIVDAFLDSGAMVAAFSRNVENIQNEKLLMMQGDLNDSVFLNNFYEEAISYFDKSVDILVNNNGGPTPGQAVDFSDKQWLEAIENNFMSVVRMSNLVLDDMKRNKFGRIINLTSSSAKEPAPGMALSNVTRAAVTSYGKTLSLNVGEYGITVNTILTGGVTTERFQSLVEMQIKESGENYDQAMERISASIPVNFVATPDDFARYVLFLASSDASYTTGIALSVDGGASKGMF